MCFRFTYVNGYHYLALSGSSQGINVKPPSSAKALTANEAVKKAPPKVASKYGKDKLTSLVKMEYILIPK